MEQEYLNVGQAAAYLQVGRQRIYELVKAGRIGRQIAQHWVFTHAELDAYRAETAKRPKGGRPRKGEELRRVDK